MAVTGESFKMITFSTVNVVLTAFLEHVLLTWLTRLHLFKITAAESSLTADPPRLAPRGGGANIGVEEARNRRTCLPGRLFSR